MRKYVIERNIPRVGSLEREQLREAAQKLNKALRQLFPDIQWVESYVAADKTFCSTWRKNPRSRHADKSGRTSVKVYPNQVALIRGRHDVSLIGFRDGNECFERHITDREKDIPRKECTTSV